MSNLPWSERVNMLSIHPHAATIEDIAKLAADASENAALRAEVERKAGQYKQIIDDVFDGCECSPKCDSYAHEEDCAATNGPVAVRKLRARVAVLEKDMSEMVAAVPHIGCHDKKNPCAKCFLISELRRRAKEG